MDAEIVLGPTSQLELVIADACDFSFSHNPPAVIRNRNRRNVSDGTKALLGDSDFTRIVRGY
jgi:hypothetical protein